MQFVRVPEKGSFLISACFTHRISGITPALRDEKTLVCGRFLSSNFRPALEGGFGESGSECCHRTWRLRCPQRRPLCGSAHSTPSNGGRPTTSLSSVARKFLTRPAPDADDKLPSSDSLTGGSSTPTGLVSFSVDDDDASGWSSCWKSCT